MLNENKSIVLGYFCPKFIVLAKYLFFEKSIAIWRVSFLLLTMLQELNKSDEDLKKLRELNKALAQEVCAFKL